MSLSKKILVLFVMGVFMISGTVLAKDKVITRTFPAKAKVDVSTVSGDLVIVEGGSDEITVEVFENVRPRDSFEPKFKERSNSLRLSEDFNGHSSSGNVTWTITVPIGTEIEFSSASGGVTSEKYSGDIEVETASGSIELFDYNGNLDATSASGDFDLTNCKGVFKISTASGDVKLNNCQGEFDAQSASGDVDANEALLEEESEFSSASGDVYIELAKSPKFELSLSSASGNSTLNFNGNPIQGSFEFIAKVRRGRIDSPIDFEAEETFTRRGDRDEYNKKTFTKGDKTPNIFISTASGRATLEEK